MTYLPPYHLAVMPKGFVPTPEMIADAAVTAVTFHGHKERLEVLATACHMAGLSDERAAQCLQTWQDVYLDHLRDATAGPVIVARQRAASAILDAVLARHWPVCTDPEGEPPPVIVTL